MITSLSDWFKVLATFTPPCFTWIALFSKDIPVFSHNFSHACVGTTAWHSRLRNKKDEGFEISRDSNFWTKHWRCVLLAFLSSATASLNLPSLKWSTTRGRPRSMALSPDKKVFQFMALYSSITEDAAVLTRLPLLEKSSGANVPLSLSFKASLSAKFLFWISAFVHIEIWTNYHDKNFAFRLALKERLMGTRKWSVKPTQAYYRDTVL